MGFLDVFRADKKEKAVPPSPQLTPSPLPPAPKMPDLSGPGSQWQMPADPLSSPPNFAPLNARLDLPPPPPMQQGLPPLEPVAQASEFTQEPVQQEVSDHQELLNALESLKIPEGEPQPPQPRIQQVLPQSQQPPAPQQTTKLDFPPVPEIPSEWGAPRPSMETLLEPLAPLPDLDEPPAKEAVPVVEVKAPPAPVSKDIPQALPDLEVFSDMPYDSTDKEMNSLRQEMHSFNTPLFVRVEDFATVSDNVSELDTLLRDSEKIFLRMKELKSFKDKKLMEWQKCIEDVQRKLVYLDNKLFEVA